MCDFSIDRAFIDISCKQWLACLTEMSCMQQHGTLFVFLWPRRNALVQWTYLMNTYRMQDT